MRNYYRIMLGQKSIYADEVVKEGYVGVGFFEDIDLTGSFPDDWREFNREYIPVYLRRNPGKSKIAAGLSCGFTWTVCRGLVVGDIVISPDGRGSYYVGEVDGEYEFHKGKNLPHRRKVKWFPRLINREDTSLEFQNSAGSIGTVSNISKHAEEIERLIEGNSAPRIVSNDDTIEDPSTFALEKHLEEFLVQNWGNTVLSRRYDIFEDEGEIIGQQYPTDTGYIDILAISKDRKELLVVELKKGRIGDVVVGQVQRYMGFVKEELAENGQVVKGVIIALEDDIGLQRALSVTSNIDFYRYKVSFKLEKA